MGKIIFLIIKLFITRLKTENYINLLLFDDL